MTPNDAIALHMQLRMSLKFHLSQREALPEEMMTRIRHENLCLIGKWLASSGAAGLRERPFFVELSGSHGEFHRQMMRVAESINHGLYADAERMMQPAGEFEAASKRLGNAIMAIGLGQAAAR